MNRNVAGSGLSAFALPPETVLSDSALSPDVLGHVMSFTRKDADEKRFRAVSKSWSAALGNYLELHVIPRSVRQVEGGLGVIWTPDSNAEFLLALLHLSDGLTEQFRTTYLAGVVLNAVPTGAIAMPRTWPSLPAVRSLVVRPQGLSNFEPEELEHLLAFMPNITDLEVDPAPSFTHVPISLRTCGRLRRLRFVRAEKLRLETLTRDLGPLETLGLVGSTLLFESDAAVDVIASHFPSLRSVELPWASGLTVAAVRSLSRLRNLESLALRDGSANCSVGSRNQTAGSSSDDDNEENDDSDSDPVFRTLCSSLRSLRTLEVTDCDIRKLPIVVSGLRSLRELHLHFTSLTSIPRAIGDLVALESLSLPGNFLQKLPDTIGQLRALQDLILWGNRLSSLPDSIGRLGRLRILDLSDNSLKELPASLGNCAALCELNLSGNELKELPKTLTRLERLRVLNIYGNDFFSQARFGLPFSLKSMLADYRAGVRIIHEKEYVSDYTMY